ncbi:MAG: septum formation initiator family protein [Bacteroidales bacterium]|nr:septum formation initiator family protein [Bacteroidales bacterium]
MNDRLSRLIDRVPPVLRNRYLLTTIIFIVWLLFFDNNNLVERYRDMAALKQLKRDREYFSNRIEEDTRKLNELKTSDENLEKFAREEYLMKKENEDIFIVVPEDEEKKKRAAGRRRFLIFQEP